jgi:hypothetical protein
MVSLFVKTNTSVGDNYSTIDGVIYIDNHDIMSYNVNIRNIKRSGLMFECDICGETDCDHEEDYNIHIQFIAKESLRKQFKIKCLQKGIKPSEWLRQQVEKFVKENEK